MHRCATCEVVLNERAQTFKYELCVNLGNDENDDIFNITGFLPSIKDFITLPLGNVDEIEEQLNDTFEQKLVEVEFTTNKKNKENIVHKITIKKN